MVALSSSAELLNWPANKWGIREPPVDEAGDVRADALDEAGYTQQYIQSNSNLQSTAVHSDCNGTDDSGLLVVVPGVAFDLCGRRLGHGKGYYDGWLERVC